MSYLKIPFNRDYFLVNEYKSIFDENEYSFFRVCLDSKSKQRFIYLNTKDVSYVTKPNFILNKLEGIELTELSGKCKKDKKKVLDDAEKNLDKHFKKTTWNLKKKILFIHRVKKLDKKPRDAFYKYFSTFLGKNIKIANPINKKNPEEVDYLVVTNTEGHNRFVFSIRKFLKTRQDRRHVIIYCYDIEKEELSRHIYYTSLSEGKFWRYCLLRKLDNAYEKGINYVTTSFIDINLQKFIFENEKEYTPIEPEVDNPIKDCKYELTDFLKKRFFTRHFEVGEPIFAIFETIFPHKTYRNPDYYNSRVEILEKLKEGNRFDRDVNKRLNDLYELLESNELLTNDGSNRRHFYTTWYQQVILKLFEQDFKFYKDTKKLVYKDKKISVKQSETIKSEITMSIYSIEIQSKITGYFYELSYMIYNSSLQPGKKFNHFISISLLSNNNLSKYGLRQKYVSAGLLINKIFDYYLQIGISKLGKESDITDTDYTFIGDVFNVPF